MEHTDEKADRGCWPGELPRVLLVGAGVVGRAIADAHLARGIAFCLADHSADAIDQASREFTRAGLSVETVDLPLSDLKVIAVGQASDADSNHPLVVIESIVEKVDAKQGLFQAVEKAFGDQTILCSNTSTLRIDEIAGAGLKQSGQLCGLHFFMPVHQRAAIEVVSGRRSDSETIDAAERHCRRLGKRAIHCQDGPGFIVNRMLSPYLNQALLLLCHGATENQIDRAAQAYGMPLSPLELIDWIGTPTMFHAGRAFWNAFPHRIDPSPMVPALLKRKRMGRASGRGLYDYQQGTRSERLADETRDLIETYRVDSREFSDAEVLLLLSIPMWIEATCLLDEGITDSMNTVDLAMVGGLGFNSDVPWSSFFDELGAEAIESTVTTWGGVFRSMRTE